MNVLKIEREPVESSNIKSIGYHKNGNTLVVEFIKGGIYSYYPVTSDMYKKLMEAKSKGEHFDKYIKRDAGLNVQKHQK